MIPIRFNDNEKITVQKLCYDLFEIKKYQKKKEELKRNLHEINDWCKNNIIIDGKKFSFPDVVKADFDTLSKIVEKLDNLKASFHYSPPPYEKYIVDYLYSNKFPRLEFIHSLGVTVCPYCNRNFINSTNKRTTCQFDHFYNKSEYPLLSVSFYNLVPVCYCCNHAKKQSHLGYSPHDKKYKTNDLIKFDFPITGMDYLFNTEDLKIEIDGNTNFKSNIETLMLNEVYQLHKDVVQECLKKAMIFSPEYINYLFATYDELFKSKDELYEMIFSNYLSEESFGKRPLSKLTHDVCDDLYDIYYGLKLE